MATLASSRFWLHASAAAKSPLTRPFHKGDLTGQTQTFQKRSVQQKKLGSGPRVPELVVTSSNPGPRPRVRELVVTSCNPELGPGLESYF